MSDEARAKGRDKWGEYSTAAAVASQARCVPLTHTLIVTLTSTLRLFLSSFVPPLWHIFVGAS